nr:immunoglobulin light chain junction region [Macaca mulatta]
DYYCSSYASITTCLF